MTGESISESGDGANPSWPPPPPPFAPPPPAPPVTAPPWALAPPLAGTPRVVTGRRIAAGLLDLVPLTVLAIALGDRTADDGRFNVTLSGIKVLWWLIAAIAYYAVAEWITRTSPGKALVGLCVRSDDAQPASTSQILKRSALRVVDILPAAYLVGLITTASSARHKRVGDMVAGTLVMHRADIGEPKPNGRSVAALVAVVAITLGAGVGVLAAAEAGATDQERIGKFELERDVIPYADLVIADALTPPSADALRAHLEPGIVSDADLRTIVTTFVDTVGSMTADYRVVDHQRGVLTLPSGKRVEAVTLRITAQFETRPGVLQLAIADVEGELRLIGLHFSA